MGSPLAWLRDPDAVSRLVVAGGLMVLGLFQPGARDLRAPLSPSVVPAAPRLWTGATYTPAEVKARLAQGATVTYLDVRAKEAYAREHIQGAINIPWGELEKGHAMLPKDRFILLYCT